MENIHKLINSLELCVPGLDTVPLYADNPETTEPDAVIDWLYNHLSEQGLMVYEEWNEYNGYIPELKPVANLMLAAEPADYIFSIIEKIDWASASIDPLELPYCMPWLEHINHYLKSHHLRLVDILPFENAYIICLHDSQELIQKLDLCLEVLGMGLNQRESLDQQQVLTTINAIISE